MSKTESGQQDQEEVGILTVGTRILCKDIMDQFIRTLGDYKTYYAETLAWGLRSFSEKQIDILITEMEFEDGSAFRLLQTLDLSFSDVYTIVAVEEENEEACRALAVEMETNAILKKPFTQKEIKEQIEQYQLWKKRKKEAWRDHLYKASRFIRQKVYTEAEKCLIAAMKAAPEQAITFGKAGQYYLANQKYDISEQFLRKAIDLNPVYVQALTALGTLLMVKGELDEAHLHLQRAHDISPLNPDRLLKIALLHLAIANRSCNDALRVDPGHPSARIMSGEILVLQREHVSAIRQFEKALPPLKDEARQNVHAWISFARKQGGLRGE